MLESLFLALMFAVGSAAFAQQDIEKIDKNIYFIDGSTLFGEAGRDNSTVDGCHPNDLGFYMMYQNVLPVLKKALFIRK